MAGEGDNRPIRRQGSSSATSRAGLPKVVLIVDDEAALRTYVGKALRREGFTVLEAPDGRSAIRLWVGLAGRLDLVVTDVRMPDSTGLELAAIIRAAHPRTPIVLMTGDPSGLLGEELGVHERVLAKPFTLDELRAAVTDALGANG